MPAVIPFEQFIIDPIMADEKRRVALQMVGRGVDGRWVSCLSSWSGCTTGKCDAILGLDYSVLERNRNSLGAAVSMQFREHVADVELDRRATDEELRGDLWIA